MLTVSQSSYLSKSAHIYCKLRHVMFLFAPVLQKSLYKNDKRIMEHDLTTIHTQILWNSSNKAQLKFSVTLSCETWSTNTWRVIL